MPSLTKNGKVSLHNKLHVPVTAAKSRNSDSRLKSMWGGWCSYIVVVHSRENEVEEVKNEGPKEMTLDEWKAMQDKERTKVEFNIRKPNEGADSQWKKGYVLHKSKSEDVSVI